MLWELEERTINLKSERQVGAVREFLQKFNLTFTAEVDYTVAMYLGNRMLATGSLAGEVLRNIAVDESLQGEGITAKLISHLVRVAAQRGFYHYFLYTRPDKAHLFSALGFTEIARVEPYAVLMESGLGSIRQYCQEISQQVADLPSGPRAGLVVNCNPFTLGHQAVIAKAAAENRSVVVLVVSEERSLFPFEVRFQLVKAGVKHLDNVVVLPAGKYLISAATFPGYFTRGEETIAAQTKLDATVFAQYIAPALGITVRYVGDEPYCQVTDCYNQALLDILPVHGIGVELMERVTKNSMPISASRVRELIRQEQWEAIHTLVPDSTFHYLCSPAAEPIIRQIQQSHSRH